MTTSLSIHDRRILTAVNSGASSLSFIGSGFIVLCYSLFKELRKFSFKLVFYLSLSMKIEDPTKTSESDLMLCGLQILPFFSASLQLSHFSLHLFFGRCRTCFAVSLTWSGTLLVMTAIRSIGNDHTHLGAWCWAQSDRTGKAIHFITFYIPLCGAILYNGFTYFQVIRMLNNATRMAVGMSDHAYHFDSRTDTKALNRWGYYPLILIGSWAFGTINRIHDFIEPGHKIFWLSILDVGTAALMGLFNSIAYGLNASVRRAIYERLELFWPEKLQRWFPNSSRYRNQEQQNELISLKIQDQQ
ncbi:hypothetical protein CRYUN_Cryun36dG0111000 [Craigia yunnanensis]